MTNDMVERVIVPYKSNPKVLGILLVGSASRYYNDWLSDFDIEVIVEDLFYQQIDNGGRFWHYKENDINIEYLVYPQSDFSAKINSIADIDHWPYEECKVLYDPYNFLEQNIPLIVSMDMETREARIKLHYFEFLFFTNKVRRALQRGDELNARLVTSQMAIVLIKLIFILFYRWPPVLHWAVQNIRMIKEFPSKIEQILLSILKQPSITLVETLIQEVDLIMKNQDIPGVFSKNELTGEVGGAEFRFIREKYGLL